MRARRPPLGPAGRWTAFALCLLALHLILAIPADPHVSLTAALLRPPLELALLVAALSFTPDRLLPLLRRALLVVLAVLVFLKLADAGFFAAFDRPFDPVLDLYLLPAGWTLLSGSAGALRAVGAVALAVLAYALVLVVLYWSLRGLAALRPGGNGRRAAAAVTVLIGLAAFAPIGPATGRGSPAPALTLLAAHTAASARSIEDATVFRQALANDPYAHIPDGALLSALKGKDVLLVFVESYGRGAIEDPRYAPVVQARLKSVEQEIGRSGFQARSAWLASPTHGGQSWLAHETMLSGLWIDGSRRYDQLIRSRRATLIRDFKRAGWRTVAVMPAISQPWPEGRFFGYDRIYAAHDLGYRGPPFNWITMPDQFTLAALQAAELGRRDRPPIMAEISLISSHAPFIPVPPLLSWKDVGDGTVYERTVKGSEPPDSLWRDMGRVGVKYAATIDYSLASVAAYVRDYGDDRTVLIALGDHQPGSVLTRPGGPHEVPIHIIAKDPKVLQTIDGWGWSKGMRPAADLPVWRMDQFRGRLLDSFTPAGR